MRRKLAFLFSLALGCATPVPGPAIAQTGLASPLAQAGEIPSYKPPLRGAPGGRVSGASRAVSPGATSSSIELLAPDRHAGVTANAAPNLYYFISGPVTLPLKFTLSAPMQPAPVVDANLVPPGQAGIRKIRLADYRVQLQPGISYKWSVSVVVDPRSPSNDIVASATLVLDAPDPAIENAARSAPPLRRAVLFARGGFWYDAVAAAVEGQDADQHAALDALLDQVGLTGPAAYDRRAAQEGSHSRRLPGN